MQGFALRLFYRSMIRDKVHIALNMGGLAAGIAAFVILGLYVRLETSFEKWLPGYGQVYLVQSKLTLPGGPFNGAYPGTMAGLLEQLREDFPGIEGTRIRGGENGGTVLRDGEAVTENVAQVDTSFLEIFPLKLITGSARGAFADPSSALISRSSALKYFGMADPIGRTMTIAVDAPATYRVAGTFEDLPANTDLKLSIIVPIPRTAPTTQAGWYQWGSASLATYLKFATPGDARAFEQKLPAFVDRRAGNSIGPSPSKIYALPLLPIADMHLTPPGPQSASRKLTIITLGILGLLTLVIAVVNYVNLATSRSGLRAREIAMRKVLGADRSMLVRQFMCESMLTVAAAAAIGLILAGAGLPLINAAGRLSLHMPIGLVLPILAVLILSVGTAAGFYPALLLSRFPAAAVLASARAPGGGQAGARVREFLVILQFGLAVALAIGTVVLVAQTRHARQSDLGFNREGLLIVPSLGDKRITEGQARSLLAAFRAMPGAVTVGVGNTAAGGGGEPGLDVVEMPGQAGLGPSLRVVVAGPGFFSAYRPRLLAGRLFSDAYGTDDSSDPSTWDRGRNIVINRKAMAALGFQSPAEAVGKTVGAPRPRTIIGVIDELRFFSPRVTDDPTYYIYFPDRIPSGAVATIRFSGDPQAILASVQATWRRLAPEVPVVAQPVGARLAKFYEADDRASRLFGIGAALAMGLACVGLWALASFNTGQRVREIGIRKALGASPMDIASLLVRQFLKPVLIGNIIAWPIAFFAMSKWLAGFGDRTELSPAFFLAASMIAVAIAVLAVLEQSLRASRMAAAECLRRE
jgi:putative ABC transport system permease protein